MIKSFRGYLLPNELVAADDDLEVSARALYLTVSSTLRTTRSLLCIAAKEAFAFNLFRGCTETDPTISETRLEHSLAQEYFVFGQRKNNLKENVNWSAVQVICNKVGF